MDATLMLTNVPATKSPEYKISADVNLVPINDLGCLVGSSWKKYVIIGGGKTGIDAILYLIENDVAPENIQWIVPNDSWFIVRDGFEDISNFCALWVYQTLDNIITSKDVNEVYKRGEKLGLFMRLDTSIWPTKMRAATVSTKEMEILRSITSIIRLGRIQGIERDTIIFKSGERIPTDGSTLHVDCSVNSTAFVVVKEKVFDRDRINLQMVQIPPACTSAAMIAAIELKFDDEQKKNDLCKPIDAPHLPSQWFQLQYISNLNGQLIGKALGLSWMRRSRLVILNHMSFWSFVKTLIFTTINKRKIAENMKLFGEQHHLYGKNLDIAQLQDDEAQSGGISGSLFSYGYLFLFLLIAFVLSYLMNAVLQ